MSDRRKDHQRRIRPFAADDELFKALAEDFLTLAAAGVEELGQFRVIMGGGKTPRKLNAEIVRSASRYAIDWTRVTICLSDERCVPIDHPDSNYLMLRQSLLDPLGIADRCLRIEGGLSPGKAVSDYEEKLTAIFGSGKQAKFDLAILGFGPDGHTASLFPHCSALDESQRPVLSVGRGPEGHERISMSRRLLNSTSAIWFLIAGEEKQDALDRLLGPSFDPYGCPAQGIVASGGEIVYFIGEGLQVRGADQHIRQ